MKEKMKAELRKKLNPKNVKKRPDSGMSYIEGWHAESEANEIFDFEWDSEIISMIENTPPTKNQKQNNVVSFRAIVRVTTPLGFKDGCGYGSGISKDIHAAYEGAIKEAETDAEKRALKKFGNRFGLALYDKTQAGVGVDAPPPLTPAQKAQAAEDTAAKIIEAYKGCKDLGALSDVQSKSHGQRTAFRERHAAGSAEINTVGLQVISGFDKPPVDIP